MSIDILIEVATEELIQDANELPPMGEVWYDKNDICWSRQRPIQEDGIHSFNIY